MSGPVEPPASLPYLGSVLIAVAIVVGLPVVLALLLRLARAGYDRLLEIEDDAEQLEGWRSPRHVRNGR